MITVMESIKEPLERNYDEKRLDPQLWHACAGGMVQMPPINSKAFYFPQGHAEHAQGNVDFGNCKIPSLILCRVSSIKYMADPETDELYAKIRLSPIRDNGFDFEDDRSICNKGSIVENPDKPTSFAKTLTQSDANNGGGFSVPRYCAETIFPRLDYSEDPPVQTILAKDVHGETWKFRHIYRGTPRRHLLTTGWSNFVNQKKLVAGDSIVFLRAENGDLCVGLRRAKKGIGGGPEYLSSGWNPAGGNSDSQFGGYSSFLRDENFMGRNCSRELRGKVKAESVIEATTLATSGHVFEVVYYPRASTPEFVVKASAVRTAMQIRWCPGMRFKMPFETEDCSRISWFMGTISSVQVFSPINWPDSPWRLLQVAWDEPDLLQNVKHVNPWLVELVSSMPAIHLSPFSPPRKKLRLPQNPDFSLASQHAHFSLPSQSRFPFLSSNLFSSNSPLSCISDDVPTGIQGARHAQFGTYSSDPQLNRLQLGLFPNRTDPCVKPEFNFMHHIQENLKMDHSAKTNEIKSPHILLFGQVILTEQQSSKSSSSDGSGSALGPNGSVENLSDGGSPCYKDHQRSDLGMETGHCKVFIESDDVGRTIDLSLVGSYEELYAKLADMFGIENSEILRNVLYRDITGSVKHTGDQPYSEFLKTARRLTILADSSSDNLGR